MECPKCAAEQADDRAECAVCGIVFERFRDAQERAALLKPRTLQQPLPVERETTISPVLFVVAILVFAAFGLVWTAKRRQARAGENKAAEANAMLNDINKKGLELRTRLENERKRALAMRAGEQNAVDQPSRKSGLSEELALQMLEQCSGFNTPQDILFPKQYSDYDSGSLGEQHPALFVAQRDKVVEVHREGNTSFVSVPQSTRDRMTVTETEDQFAILVGHRRITGILDLTGTPGSAAASFELAYDERIAAETFLKADDFSGIANFLLKDGAWEITRAVSGGKSLCP